MAGIVSVYCTLRVIGDINDWVAALIKPYDLYYFRYFAMMPLGWVLWQKDLSKRQLGILGLAALCAALVIAWANRRYAVSTGAASAQFYEDLKSEQY